MAHHASELISRLSHKAHKLPQEVLDSALQEAAEACMVLESTFECLTSGLVIVDNNGVVRYANKTAIRLLSLNVQGEDAEGKVWELFSATGSSEVSAFLHDALSSGDTNTSSEFSLSSGNTDVRFVSVSIQSLVTHDTVSGSIITVLDVTQKRKSEIYAHRMESLAELTNLAANMAHEIKNPLGAISIHVQLAQKALAIARGGEDGSGISPSGNMPNALLPDEKYIDEPLRVVNEEVDNLNRLVMQFLMAVRPIKADMEIVDVRDVIAETIDFVSPEFEKHGFAASYSVGDKKIRLLIDRKLFKEVLVNMAQNSLAALLARFENNALQVAQGYFEVNSTSDNNDAIITVSDNGCGIESTAASHIFEPYFTTKADGTGLGMTMAYKIVKEFKGNIELKQNGGQDEGGKNKTVFVIHIPLPQSTEVKSLEHIG